MKNLDDASEFSLLTETERQTLLEWVVSTLQPGTRVCRYDSYALKHFFERSPGAFYVTNGAFKGAMLECGFVPVKKSEQNWRFKIRPAKECPGRLRRRTFGTYPCWHEPNLFTGLCTYHEQRRASGLPIIPEVYPDHESWMESRAKR